MLLKAGADVHAYNDYSLFLSSHRNNFDVVKVLIETGANVNARNVLYVASENGCLEIVKILLEAGADVHKDGDWALQTALKNNHQEIIKVLLKAGADINNIKMKEKDNYIISFKKTFRKNNN